MKIEIKNIFKNISEREKILIYASLLIVVIFLVYQVVLNPFLKARDEYGLEIVNLEKSYDEIKVIAGRYISEKDNLNKLRQEINSKKELSALTYLEKVSENVGLRDNIEYIKPKGNEIEDGLKINNIEVKIDSILISNLMIFLQKIEEDRKGLIVTYLRLRPFFKDREKADVIVGITDVTVD